MAKAKKTLEQLQEEHSEMLATADDLGMDMGKYPDLTADFSVVDVGATIVSNLDALIRQFRRGIDEVEAEAEASKNALVEELEKSETEQAKKTAPKKSAKKTKPTEAAPAEAEDNSGEDQVAKKAVKAKAKTKPAKKAGKTKVAKKAVKRARFPDDATIKWSAGKKNPAREGAGRHGRIEKVMKASGKTVKAFLAGGGNPTTLGNCVKAKLCSVG
jgi:Sec-independent protein translocase protein TatA